MTWKVPAPTERVDFKPAPAGLQPLVLVDIIDRGFRLNTYNPQDIKVRREVTFRYALDAVDEETGKQFFIDDKVTFSPDKRSTMRQRISDGLGREFSDAEFKGFDIESLVGMNFQGMIVHKVKNEGTDDEKVYANLKNLMPPAKGSSPVELKEEYKRKYKDYSGSLRWPSVNPKNKQPLTDQQIEVLNAMPNDIRGALEDAIESVVGLGTAAGAAVPAGAGAVADPGPSDADDPGPGRPEDVV